LSKFIFFEYQKKTQMHAILELSPYDTHLQREVVHVAAACNVPVNCIVKKYFVYPQEIRPRVSQTNFASEFEAAMYEEKEEFPGKLFLCQDGVTNLVLVTDDRRLCIGRYGCTAMRPDEEETYYMLENRALFLYDLRHRHIDLLRMIRYIL
jgi:hypothetical protein